MRNFVAYHDLRDGLGFNPFTEASVNIYNQFRLVPTLCESANRSGDGLEYFPMLEEPASIEGVYAAGSPIGKYFRPGQKHSAKNFFNALELARYGLLKDFVGFTQSGLGDMNRACVNPEEWIEHNKEKTQGGIVPYQLAYSELYKFNQSRCGCFGDANDFTGCGGVQKFESGAHTWSKYDENGQVWWEGPSAMSLDPPMTSEAKLAAGTPLPEEYWDVSVVCPNWRLLCGTEYPPNLPELVRKNCPLKPDHYWVQLPMTPTSIGDPQTQWEERLEEGRLPDGRDFEMEWVQIHGDSELCRRRSVNHAAKSASDAALLDGTKHPRSACASRWAPPAAGEHRKHSFGGRIYSALSNFHEHETFTPNDPTRFPSTSRDEIPGCLVARGRNATTQVTRYKNFKREIQRPYLVEHHLRIVTGVSGVVCGCAGFTLLLELLRSRIAGDYYHRLA